MRIHALKRGIIACAGAASLLHNIYYRRCKHNEWLHASAVSIGGRLEKDYVPRLRVNRVKHAALHSTIRQPCHCPASELERRRSLHQTHTGARLSSVQQDRDEKTERHDGTSVASCPVRRGVKSESSSQHPRLSVKCLCHSSSSLFLCLRPYSVLVAPE